MLVDCLDPSKNYSICQWLSSMNKLILSLLCVGVVGCSNSPKMVEAPIYYPTVDTIAPSVKESYGKRYLLSNEPLSKSFISLPFLFDGDVVLRTDFDVLKWKNKRFISIEGKEFSVAERYVVDMRKGKIRQLTKNIEFKGLEQSLLIKLMPLSYDRSTPEFLVISNFKEDDGNASVLIIEDPDTQRIHGFIESAIISL
jgi:hypothetical protein